MGWMLAAVTGRPHVWHIREFGDRDYELQPDFGAQLFRKGMVSAAARVTVSRAILAQLLPGRLASGAHVVYNGVAFRHDFDRLQKK